jgi:hypothetical protein
MVERSDEGATTAEMKGWIMEAIGSIDSMDALSDIYDYVMFKHSQIFRDEKKSNKSASME